MNTKEMFKHFDRHFIVEEPSGVQGPLAVRKWRFSGLPPHWTYKVLIGLILHCQGLKLYKCPDYQITNSPSFS